MTNISRRGNNVRGMFANRRNQTSGDSDGMSSHLRTFSCPLSEYLWALIPCAHRPLGAARETTRIHKTIGWVRGRMAAYGARPAGNNASDRVSQQWIA